MLKDNTGDRVRLVAVGALGVGAAVFAFVTGIPGSGAFLAVAWLAGLVAVLVRPGWGGFVTLAGAIAVAAVIADLSDRNAGLVALVVASLLVPAAHGALVGSIARRVVTLGPAQSLRDGRVIAALLGGLVVVALVALVAADFARNPP